MKAVILAGGKGTRMGELTKNIPKPLLNINGKTLIEYKIDILPDECEEVIIVIGHLGEKIREYFHDEYKGKKITYVYSDTLGSGYALWQAKEHLDGKFIVMNGDDLFTRKDVQECLKHDFACLVYTNKGEQSGGKIILKDGLVHEIIEGTFPAETKVNVGLYVLQPEIFQTNLVKIVGREEYGLPQTIMQMANKKIHPVQATAWHQVTSPKDLQISGEELEWFL